MENRSFSKIIQIILLVVFNVLGQATENVSVIFWVGDLMKYGAGGPYFILFILSASFVVFFFLCLVIDCLMHKEVGLYPFKLNRKLHFNLFVIGFYNAVNGFLILYASPAERTPPIVQAIMGNSGLLVSALASKYILKKEKKYLTPIPVIAGVLIVAAIVLSIAPDFQHGHTGFHSASNVWWSVCFGLGFVPGVLYNTYQERFLGQQELSTMPHWTRIFCVLFWGCLWVFILFIAGFWVDLIPHFGFSNIHTFMDHLDKGFTCNFSFQSPCSFTFLYGVCFFFGYVISYIAAAKINEESTDFNMVTQIFVTPVVVMFWLIFRDLDPSSERTPYWSVFPALILTIVGAIIWKYWEYTTKEKSLETTPLISQRGIPIQTKRSSINEDY